MNNYIYADDAAPVLPTGTVLHITAWHDNTAANPNNPDPNQWVGWGERTVDEMSHAWVNVTYISEDDYQSYVAKKKSSKSRAPLSQRLSGRDSFGGPDMQCAVRHSGSLFGIALGSAALVRAQNLPLGASARYRAERYGRF